ncbi:MAG: L-histidine N(alpha)-methyltransferase [Pseudobdellovibrionaceae bacterium]
MRKLDCDCLRPLTEDEQETFRTFSNLLAGKEEGTASHLAFLSGPVSHDPGDGLFHWEEACRIKEFPVNREIGLARNPQTFERVADAFAQAANESRRGAPKQVSVIEIGAGLWEAVEMKTVPMIEALRAKGFEIAEYIVIDPSKDCADAAAEGIGKLYNIPTRALHENFEDVGQLNTSAIPVTMMWGPTIWNASKTPNILDETVLQNQLKVAGAMTGGYMISTYYSSADREVDAKAYNDERNLKLVKAVGHRIAHDLRGHTDFDPDTFEAAIEYVGNGVGRHRMRLVSKIDQTIHLGSLTYNLRAGEGFTVNNSWRMDEPSFYRIAGRANLEIKSVEYDKANAAGIFLAKHIS